MTSREKEELAEGLAVLDDRLNTILPAEYQGAYDEVSAAPMRSAGLRFDAEGRVAWNEIWGSFCDLAMAGGPPHKGALLAPGAPADIEAQPDRHRAVIDEISRGITMATGLPTEPPPAPGWIRVRCLNETMAQWLLRAITMENVAVRAEGSALDLPAAPGYRLEKEIKNVVTVIAKTSHYWLGHMPRLQHRMIGRLFDEIAADSPLIEPEVTTPDDERRNATASAMSSRIEAETGLRRSELRYPGWLGIEVPSVRKAIWMMRALVVSNVLARREGTVVLVPIAPERDPDGEQVIRTLVRVHALANAKGIV